MTFLVGDPTIVSLYTLNNHLEIAWGGHSHLLQV